MRQTGKFGISMIMLMTITIGLAAPAAATNSMDRQPGFYGLFPRAKSYCRPIVELGTVVLQESKLGKGLMDVQ
jgi:hypothetical protein